MTDHLPALARQWPRLSAAARSHHWRHLTPDDQARLRELLANSAPARPRWSTAHRLIFLGVVAVLVLFGALTVESLSRMKEAERTWRRERLEREAADATQERLANPRDVSQARDFLEGLPAACGRSSMRVLEDGTVRISIVCRGAEQSMNGTVSIQDGVVTELR